MKFLTEKNYEPDCNLEDKIKITESFTKRGDIIKRRINNLNEELNLAEKDSIHLLNIRKAFNSWTDNWDVPREPPDMLDKMDIKLRYLAFKLATHYWEGRWLIEA